MKRKTECVALFVFLTVLTVDAAAQIAEATGTRALGMGGAFVAVADDSSAVWWNPAGLAVGQLVDASYSWVRTQVSEQSHARRDRMVSFTLGTPPLGFGYYRSRVTVVRPVPTAERGGGREDGLVIPIRSLSTSQLGVTFVQTLFPGVHAGTTVKYVRATLRGVDGEDRLDTSTLLAKGEELEGGKAQGRFDLDVGVIAISGPIRVGGVVRNVRQPEVGAESVTTADIESVRNPRQFRVGVAYDAEAVDRGALTIALDADVRTYQTLSGDRRVVAIGAEQWLLDGRLGVRGGARFNTVGNEERAVAAGLSVLIRSALYFDGYVVGGGTADERGWGLAARVSF